MSSLRSIVYVSTAVRTMSEPELEALLLEARRLNLETETTGILLYSDGNFMQCFEGSNAAVEITYDRIRHSRKHSGIIELIDEPVPARTFPEWLMGFKNTKASVLLALSSARWQRQLDEASPGMVLLKHFWRNAI